MRELLDNLEKKNAKLDNLYLASAYFNPPYAIWDQLSRLNVETFNFVTATKEVIKSN